MSECHLKTVVKPCIGYCWNPINKIVYFKSLPGRKIGCSFADSTFSWIFIFMVYQGTTQYWEKQYFEITPLYCNVFVIILFCEDMDKLPFCLPEIWQKVEALYPLQNAGREEAIPT